VFWVDANGINQADIDGSSSMLLASSVSPSSLAADDNNVYWPDGSNVDFVPIDGGTVSQQPLGSSVLATEVATDYIRVYVALADGIASFPCGGGAVASIVTGESSPHGLHIAGGVLYWANDDNQLRSVKTDGSGLQTLAAMSSAIGRVALDTKLAFYVWNGGVLAIPNDGSGVPSILAGSLANVTDLVADGQSVYWTDSYGISKVPVIGGATTLLVPAPAGGIAVEGMSVYWTTATDVLKLTPK
jgi:hypothetical protein